MSLKTATLRMPQRTPRGRILNRNVRSPYRGNVRSRSSVPSHPLSRSQVLAGLLCLVLVLLGGWTGYQVRLVAEQVEALRAEAAELETRNEVLLQAKKDLISGDNLKEMGSRLGLHPPRKEQLVLLR